MWNTKYNCIRGTVKLQALFHRRIHPFSRRWWIWWQCIYLRFYQTCFEFLEISAVPLENNPLLCCDPNLYPLIYNWCFWLESIAERLRLFKLKLTTTTTIYVLPQKLTVTFFKYISYSHYVYYKIEWYYWRNVYALEKCSLMWEFNLKIVKATLFNFFDLVVRSIDC